MRRKLKRAEATEPEDNRQRSDGVAYAFPSKSRCPRCGSLTTQRTSTDGGTQYRRCRAPICRHAYRVVGTPI